MLSLVGMRAWRRGAVMMSAAAFALLYLPSAASAATSPSPAAAAAAPTQEQLDAIVKPSIVLITGEYTGHVRFLNANNGHSFSGVLHAAYYCSGFVVANVDGEATIATAGHCADKGEGRNPLILAFLAQQVKQHFLTAAQARKDVNFAETNDTVLGTAVGTPIIQDIDVYEPSAVSGLSTSTKLIATVEADKPFTSGDTALLQVHTQQPLPVLQIATAEPNPGDQLTAVGYPSAVTDISDASLNPSFETGHMNSLQTRSGLPVIQFDAGLSPGMSGGPVVNADGQVIGINSYRNSTETQQFNFAVDLSTIKSFFSSHSVPNTLSAADAAYRTGLNDYYAGKYREAVAALNTTLNTIPSDAVAAQYKSQAIALYPKETVPKKKSSGGGAGIIIVVLVVVLIVGGIAVALMMRSRRPAAVPAPAGWPTQPPAPMQPTMPMQTAAPVQPVQQAPPPQAPPVQQAPPPPPPPPAAAVCPTCGKQFPVGQRFCPDDGTPLT